MKRIACFILFVLLFSSLSFALDMGYGEGKAVYIGGNEKYGLLKGDNRWEGVNVFENITYMNITYENASYLDDVYLNYLNFNTTICTDTDDLPEGTVCWNPDQKTINIVRGNGQVIQAGKEVGDDGINVDSITLLDGSLVCMNGFQGDNPTFVRADATDPEVSAFCGILTVTCDPSELCPVTVFGFVMNVDTSDWNTGDFLYSDPNSLGGLTTDMPEFFNDQYVYGIVGRVSSTVGTIFSTKFINPSNGFLINNIYATGDVTVQGTLNVSNMLFGDDWHYITDNYFSFNESKLSTNYYNKTEIDSRGYYLFNSTNGIYQNGTELIIGYIGDLI